MYRIGMFSKLGKVTVKTLHHYNEVGLLTPAHVDDETGYRYYTTAQLFRLNEIIALRQMGFSIPEITAIVDGHNAAGIFLGRKAELECEAITVADRLFRLNNYINERKEGALMEYQAVIKEIPSYTVYSYRTTIPGYSSLNEIMPSLGKKVTGLNPGIKCVEPDYCFNVYLDGEYRDTDISVEICQAVVSPGKDGEGIVFKEIPAITAVAVLHRGPYEKIGSAYAYAVKWAEQNGYRITDNIRESYIDGVWNKENAEDWLTEIQVPVEK
ncbi:MAG: MerR family transcriptional regulator [Oscillospiraceae bacterium]|jgi:DNA-binding transcriptional MerR regulator|nr:MerR family transcriptional regulator [Oscillospiraceae bacterium]